MKCILILLSLIFTRCYSFVTLSLDEIKKNSVDEFSSDTTQSYLLTNLADDETTLEEQKNWVYPVESTQVNPEGQKLERLLSEFNVPKNEKMGPWLKQLRLLPVEPMEGESRLKNFDKKYVEVLMKDVNILGNLLDSSPKEEPKLNAIYLNGLIDGLYFNPGSLSLALNSERGIFEDKMNSAVNEADQFARIRYFFEDLCRKHHSILSKFNIEHNHYPSSDPMSR